VLIHGPAEALNATEAGLAANGLKRAVRAGLFDGDGYLFRTALHAIITRLDTCWRRHSAPRVTCG